LYIQLVKDSIWYRASDEAIAYLKQEIERPVVSMRMLQTRPAFDIARAHALGQPDHARVLARHVLNQMIGTLNNELRYLLTKHLPTNGVSNAEEESDDRLEGRSHEEESGS